ncbi:hypothetical protein V5799_021046 [Amblyomma americanum]|uniref:Intraflagellar transport protein 81 homolog n=1 Tax=Amblyomma americanum TaxID=6943 RepID=A0AAQ4FPY5_AMBAM
MSEQLKFIVQELNKEPFNKKLNLISFDAYRPDQLLQTLMDVFAELDPKSLPAHFGVVPLQMKADVRSEDPEQLAMKNLSFLRILKYKPPPDIAGRGSFRQGLVAGAKEAVLPVLEWTLRGLPELRKRAYLGRFLVKVDVPPELDGDVDLQALYAQAAVIARKKEAAAETLNELRLQVAQLEAQLQEKQSLVSGGEQVLKGDEFKKYVNALRGKSSQYKQQRQELAELRAETGVLARTQEILTQKERELTQSLEVASLRSELNSEESKLNFLQHSLRIHEVQLNFLKANGVLGNPAAEAGSDSQTSLSPSRSASRKKAKKGSKSGTPRQQATPRSGAERRLSPGATTPPQTQGATATDQQQSEKPKDATSATPQVTAAGKRSSDLVPYEYYALPPLLRRVTYPTPTPTPPDVSPPKALPQPVTPTLPPPSQIPDGRPSTTPPSRASAVQLSSVRLRDEPTSGQRQPVPTAAAQGSPAGHQGSQQSASEAAIPSEEPSAPPPKPTKVKSHSAKLGHESRPTSPPVKFAEERPGEHGGASPQEASSGQQDVEIAFSSPAAATGDVTFADRALQGANAQHRRESVMLRRESLRQRRESVQLRFERRRKDPVFLFANLIGPALDATMSATVTGHLDTGINESWSNEAKARGLLFTILHCLAQALVNILIKQVVGIPKTKIAYFVAFGYMYGSMPEAFELSKPFAPRHVQVHLVLRGLSSLMSLMLKAEALRYLVVSDLAVAYTLVPVCVMVLSWYFIGEGMGMALWTSVALCLCGVVIVMRPTIIFEEWNADTTQARLTGFLYAFGSSLALVALIILVRVTQTATSRFVSFNSGLTRTVLVIFMAMASGDFDLFLDGRFLATLVMMGKLSFCTIYFLNKALLTESGAFVATIKFSGDIILSVILQMAFLDLYPDMWTLGGIALVVLSFLMIACQNIVPSLWERRRQRRASRTRRQTLKTTDDEGTSAAADNL